MIRHIPLGEVSRFIRGITFKPHDVCENHSTGSIVCMRTKNVQTTLDTTDLISVPRSFTRRKEQYLQCGDLLVSSANSFNLVGKACWVPELPYEATAGGFISILRCDQSAVDPRFFFHWVTSDRTQQNLRSCGRQTTNISNLDFSQALALPFPLPVSADGVPDLKEQKRIASALDKADDIRRRRREALALSDHFLRSLFLEMFGDPVTNPKGWPEDEFGNLVSSTKLGLVRSSKEFGWSFPTPYVRMDAISSNGRFLPEKVQGTHASAREIREYGLTHGDFLFNTRNSKELVGKSAVYDGPESATFNNNLMRIRFRDGVDPYVVRFQFDFARAQIALEQRKQGTTSVFAVYWKNLATLPILVPPPELQRAFRALVDRTATANQRLTSSRHEAEALFQSLQQRAFTAAL